MPSATCRHSATPEGGVLHAHGVKTAGKVHRKNHRLVTKQSWRFVIELSIIIDNFILARQRKCTADMSAEEKSQQVQRKAAMAVLAHSDAAEIADRLRTSRCRRMKICASRRTAW